MKKQIFIFQCLIAMCCVNQMFSQIKLKELTDFVEPAGNWVKAGEVRMDSLNPDALIFKKGSDCFVNGEDGKAKYLVSKKAYQDMEMHPLI